MRAQHRGVPHCLLVLALVCLGVSTPQALARRSAGPKDKRVAINILHVNDVHNRVDPGTASASACSSADDALGLCFGGYSRVASFVKQARAEDPQTLFLDSGDQFSGTSWDSLFRSNLTATFLNALKPDAQVVGNHEWDFGSKALADYIKRADFPVLGACNVDVSKSRLLPKLLKKFHVKTIKGKKIAFLGVVTPDTQFTSSANDGERFFDAAAGLSGCLQALYKQHGKSIDAVIVLSHLGYEEDKFLAQNVPGIDLIIGGHSHFLLYNGQPPLKNAADPRSFDTDVKGPYPTYVNSIVDGRPVPIVTAFFASRYIGKLTLMVGGGRPSEVMDASPVLLGGSASSNNVPRDAQMDELIQQYRAPVDAASTMVVGTSAVLLSNAAARFNESNLGNLICDAILDHVKTKTTFESTFGPVNICVFNGGGIRSSLQPGPITMGQVISVLPFGNTYAIINVRGADLIRALGNSVSALGLTSGTGRFAQVSGLRYVFNSSLLAVPTPNDPVASLQRITYAKIVLNGQEQDINPCAFYSVVTPDFTATGGDLYTMFAPAQRLLPSGTPVEQVLAEYIFENSPVSPELEGRIINCELGYHPSCGAGPATLPTTCAAN